MILEQTKSKSIMRKVNPMNTAKNKPNRLGNEKSPYLLQHAYNPVDWFPWGEEAFERARLENKPIFLSIGYSTCHWCHVMEEESFENIKIAEILNRDFICIKVDREERPDVDSVYMAACQAMTGQGGWPLTVLMTPECRPFYTGTYFPPYARYGRAGLIEVLTAAAGRWRENREALVESAGEIEAFLKEQERRNMSAEPGIEALHQAFSQFARNYDKKNGGFGAAPKFPTPHNLMFLMEYGAREQVREALDMAEKTLTQMYRGGIFDHIGGGFSRYSTDERWLVPHFEKMLYDNALLVMAYVQAFGLTGRKLYQTVAERVLDYVERELTDRGGGFYCGQDADSEGVEGKYYVFTPEEIEKVLGEEQGEVFCSRYGITERGNFEGKSIPNLLENGEYETMYSEDGAKLYQYRAERTRLHKDDKILVSWNGWMICAYAAAGAVFGRKSYVQMAVRAAEFIWDKLRKDGRLMVRYRDGDAAGEGKLDDYACYILGLLELYKATFETDYLKRAQELTEVMMREFFDPENGGFYLYAADGEQLIVRTKETYDGAVPSGNSAAARALHILAQITGQGKWQQALEKQLRFLAGGVEGYPSGHSYGLLTMMDVLYPSKELICTIAPHSGEDTEKLYEQLGGLIHKTPGLTAVVKTAENREELGRLAAYTQDYPLPEDGARFYLCIDKKCLPPVKELSELVDKLE